MKKIILFGTLVLAITLTVKSQNTSINAAIAFYNNGIVKYDLEDFEGAIIEFDQAIALDSLYVDDY